MSSSINRRGVTMAAATIIALLATLAVASQATAATYYACVKKSGAAHIFTKKPKCRKGERKLSWNTVGPPGMNGANGANGLNGANGKNGTNGVAGKNGEQGKEGATGPAGVAPNVFVGNKELSSGLASLMSVAIPLGSAAGGTISFTVVATDGGSQTVVESGLMLWTATTNSVTCTVDPNSRLHLGTVNASCSPGFFNPGSQPGVSIFDSPSFSSPAPVVVNHVWFTITNNSGDLLRLE
jgi:hypothetical protein